MMHVVKGVAIATAAALAGNLLFDKVLAKTADNPKGFVELKEGFGTDELIRGLTIGATLYLAQRLFRSKSKAA